MKLKILFGFLLGVGGSLLQGAAPSSPVPFLPGLDPALAAQIAGFAEQVNQARAQLEQALQRAVEAETRAAEAERRIGQVAQDRDVLMQQQTRLLDEATDLEQALKAAEDLAEERKKLLVQERKEKGKAQEQLAQLTVQMESNQAQLKTATESRRQLEIQRDELRREQESSAARIAELTGSLSSLQPKPYAISRSGAFSVQRGVRIAVQGMGGVVQEMQQEQAQTEKIKEVREELAQLEFQKSTVAVSLERAVEQLAAKDAEIVRLQGQLEQSEQKAGELEKFKQVEEEHGFAYLLEGDVPTQESAELGLMVSTADKLPDASLKTRIIAVLRKLNGLLR